MPMVLHRAVSEHPGTLKDPSKVRDSWSQTFGGSANSHNVAGLEEGMKYTPISISPNEAQFLETRKFQIDEIARIFRVPLGNEFRLRIPFGKLIRFPNPSAL